jgi:exopolysaccharide biosynthesis predicted pyruvyltransferase EpsI
VSQFKNNAVTAASLLFVIFLWGGNNAGTKWLVASHVRRACFKSSPDHRV